MFVFPLPSQKTKVFIYIQYIGKCLKKYYMFSRTYIIYVYIYTILKWVKSKLHFSTIFHNFSPTILRLPHLKILIKPEKHV